MAWLYHFNQIVTHGMEGFLETAVINVFLHFHFYLLFN